MIEQRLEDRLINLSFQRKNSNTEGIYFYYRIVEGEVTIVSAIYNNNGLNITSELYDHIMEQIRASFINHGYVNIHFLSLLFTLDPERVKSIYEGEEKDTHWLIDLKKYNLIIYENQDSDFMGLRKEIDHILEEAYQDVMEGKIEGESDREAAYGSYRDRRSSELPPQAIQFTLMNTSIIVINVIVHIILHYTNLFGGLEVLLEKGALSWKSVIGDEQYYRILTAMFMHADLGHIFNNMLVLLFVGEKLERAVGRLKYLCIYFGTGIIAGISSISYNMIKENSGRSIGASGAIFGVVGALLYIIIINRGRLEEIRGRQMVLFAFFSLYGGLTSVGIDNTAHIGGFIAGILLAMILYRRPKKIE